MNLSMDVNTLRSLVTAFSLQPSALCFLWAFWFGLIGLHAKPDLTRQRICRL